MAFDEGRKAHLEKLLCNLADRLLVQPDEDEVANVFLEEGGWMQNQVWGRSQDFSIHTNNSMHVK